MVVNILVSLFGQSLCDLFSELRLVFIESLLVGNILYKFVVDLGKLLGLDFMELDLELSVFALELLSLIFLGEGDVNGEFLAGAMTDYLLLKAGNEVSGTERKAVVLSFAAFKGYAVGEALKVNNYGIAVLCSSVLNNDHAGVAVSYLLDLRVNELVGDFGGFLFDLKTLVAVYGQSGLYEDIGLEGKAVLARLDRLELFNSDDLQLLLLSRLIESIGIALLHRVVIEHLGAVHSLDDVSGSLALSESGDIDLLDLLLIYLVDRFFKGFAVYSDGKFVSVSRFLLVDILQCHFEFLQ